MVTEKNERLLHENPATAIVPARNSEFFYFYCVLVCQWILKLWILESIAEKYHIYFKKVYKILFN